MMTTAQEIDEKYRGHLVQFIDCSDPGMHPVTVNVNQHQTPEFDGLMDLLSMRFKRRIRHIRSAGGTKVTTHADLKTGREYIAYSDHFTPIRYGDIVSKKPPYSRKKGFKKIDYDRPVPPVRHARDKRYREKSAKATQLNERVHGLRFHCYSFENCGEGSKVVSVKNHQRIYTDQIMDEIVKKWNAPPDSKVFKIDRSNRDCREVIDLGELENEDEILLVRPKPSRISSNQIRQQLDKFGKPYRHMLIPTSTPRSVPHYNHDPFGPPPALKNRSPQALRSRNDFTNKRPLPSISSKQSGSPYSNPPSQGRRNQQHSNRSKQINYDEDNSGVYRAKNQDNSRGANQEDFTSKEKTTPIPPGTELNKKPSKEQKQDADLKKQKKSEEKVNEDLNEGKRSGYDLYHDESFDQTHRSNDPRNSTPASVREAREREAREREALEREALEREEQKRVQAATTLQAGAKGWKARKEVKAKKEEKKRLDDMRKNEDTRKPEDHNRRQEEAATKIQAGFKGFQARKQTRAKLQGQK